MAGILIVDDSALMRKILAKIIRENTNLEIVGEAKDGIEAYNMYARFNPDLVTMDMVMPNLDGLGALRKILSDFPEANIIMISAINKKKMVLDAIKWGAANFILKPISTKKVLDAVKDVFGQGAAISVHKTDDVAEPAPMKNGAGKGSILIYIDSEENTYDNYPSWIGDIEDELHRELVELWAEKVADGEMTIEQFNVKIKKIV